MHFNLYRLALEPLQALFHVAGGGDLSLFSLTLDRAFKRGRHTDFVGVEGLPGIFIANQLNLNAFTEASMRWYAEDTDYEKFLNTRVSLRFIALTDILYLCKLNRFHARLQLPG